MRFSTCLLTSVDFVTVTTDPPPNGSLQLSLAGFYCTFMPVGFQASGLQGY